MAMKQFTLKQLHQLDGGKVNKSVDDHIARAVLDCLDRPGDEKPRKIKIEIEITPVLDEDMTCTEVKTQIFVDSKVPVYRTKVYSMGPRKNGMLAFNEDSPDNVNQQTLLDGDDEQS